MKKIELDVEGLPEPMVEALKKMVDALREHFRTKKSEGPPAELPEWPGEVIEPLTREKIYEDVD